MYSLLNLVYQLARTARPRQWLKNLSIFAAPVFSGMLFNRDVLSLGLKSFVAFCLVSSGAYFVNDIMDRENDRQHPIKKNRPIASGKIPVWLGWFAAFILMFGPLFWAYQSIGRFFAYSLMIYITLQILYSSYFRNVIILDSLVVGAGFVIRVFAGGVGTGTSLSSWLVLATIGLSLLLAFGKRRSEKTLLRKYNSNNSGGTRVTLQKYPETLLDSMISMSASICVISYSLFTFQIPSGETGETLANLLPNTLKSPKWMMVTIPLVIYGVARYLFAIYEREDAESPERVLLSDKPLLATVALWGLAILSVVYIIPKF